jgi:hypothetical protein
MSTISVVIVAFRLYLSIDRWWGALFAQLQLILANPSGGGGESDYLIALNGSPSLYGIADRCKWYKYPTL